MEQFKPFPLNPAVQVGNLGTIIRPNGRLASKQPDNIGYLKISIVVDGALTAFKQHRVCALTWVVNPHNLPEVNHLDGIKVNNAANNLEWTTHKDNILHARKLKPWKSSTKTHVVTPETRELMRLRKIGKTKRLIEGKWKWFDK